MLDDGCRYTGYYIYRDLPRRHWMDVTLAFKDGRISGDGMDDIGSFVIAGQYDLSGTECSWHKKYVGAHDVYYKGYRDAGGKRIWGIWAIPPHDTGGFLIWRDGFGESTEEVAEAATPIGSPSN